VSPIVLILITLLFSAFFSGMEIAFVSSNKLQVEIERSGGRVSPRIIGWLNRRPEYFIATMLVGNNISLVIYGLQMAILLRPWIAGWTDHEIWILVIQTLLATAIILITAEFLPKTIFRLRPNQVLRFFAIPLIILYFLLYPVTLIAVSLSEFMLKRIFSIPGTTDQKAMVFGRVDLDHLIRENQPEEQTQHETNQKFKLFQNALDFSKVRLRDCMIPRTEIEALEVHTSIEELKQRYIESGLSRILIYEEQIDQIVGYTHHSDLFKDPQNIRSIVRPVPIVPETMPANKLLSQLLAEHLSLAVVVDEFGGTAGLVTTEDILEEIFGDIIDEHDKPEYIERKIDENTYRFSGRLEIDYLNENYPFTLPASEDYETLAGLIIFYHTSIPKVNEVINIKGFNFRILRSSSTRIELVELTCT